MKEPILILHGWGSTVSGERFSEVKKLLTEQGFSVLTPDLPGFGSNLLKKQVLHFEDYVQFVADFLKKEKINKVILLGHSFGGRIAIAFATRYPEHVSKLILVSPSGIPHPLPSLKKKIVYVSTKILRPLFSIPPFSSLYNVFRKIVYYALGEMDYYKSGKLKETFKNVYQVSIVPLLSSIQAPTLLVWGENDTFVPVSDGSIMKEKIKNVKLVIEKGEGHNFPYANPKLFVTDIMPFIK